MKNFASIQALLGRSPLLRLRLLVQWGMLCWCLVLGVQLGLFVRHFDTGGRAAYYPRFPGVEAFLPIGALVSLKNWLLNGQVDTIHPAALVLFVTFVALALITRKSFCSWLCPVGTIEELMWKLGQRLFGRLWQPWRWLDRLLQSLKYLLLIIFVKLILIDMPALAVKNFLAAPYWAMADVKMLHFFAGLAGIPLITILLLLILSLFFRNPWCRYLCPYGALLGIFSVFSPSRIRRDPQVCIDCGTCSRVCPARLPVAERIQILSPECTGCLTCVANCPQAGALNMALLKHPLPQWVFPLMVLLVFTGGVAGGMLSGHWQTSLSYADYQRLIPFSQFLGH
ncbi:4Fe-4S binding protein [Geopsychrobacter electrodiphilus]|uniref:4Fe-4S binding protein n=1 Tax=Geopsychrobacter electrodiphilus TaxID=225196 RepID=UPI000369DB78|nr:4Fe-4S binding protein [Geopsychrobacter electrodiphilus]